MLGLRISQSFHLMVPPRCPDIGLDRSSRRLRSVYRSPHHIRIRRPQDRFHVLPALAAGNWLILCRGDGRQPSSLCWLARLARVGDLSADSFAAGPGGRRRGQTVSRRAEIGFSKNLRRTRIAHPLTNVWRHSCGFSGLTLPRIGSRSSVAHDVRRHAFF